MKSVESRLNGIEAIIEEKSFRENKGLGNEVGYYIFDYAAKDEIYVRNYIKYLKTKVNKSNHELKIVEFDLYEIVINILREKGYLEKCFQFEKAKGVDYTFEAVIKVLRLTGKNNLIVNYILENTPSHSVVFITGVGKCFPLVRSHNVLNNLNQVLDTVPVVMFFPGDYSGQELNLFGKIKEDNYYRAFKLVER